MNFSASLAAVANYTSLASLGCGQGLQDKRWKEKHKPSWESSALKVLLRIPMGATPPGNFLNKRRLLQPVWYDTSLATQAGLYVTETCVTECKL